MTQPINTTELRGEAEDLANLPDDLHMHIRPETVLALLDTVEAAQALEWRGLPDTWATRQLRQTLARFDFTSQENT
jgi:hypothetical protein